MIRSTLSSIGAQALPKASINQLPLYFLTSDGKDYQVAIVLVRPPMCYQVLTPKLVFAIVAASKRPEEPEFVSVGRRKA